MISTTTLPFVASNLWCSAFHHTMKYTYYHSNSKTARFAKLRNDFIITLGNDPFHNLAICGNC